MDEREIDLLAEAILKQLARRERGMLQRENYKIGALKKPYQAWRQKSPVVTTMVTTGVIYKQHPIQLRLQL